MANLDGANFRPTLLYFPPLLLPSPPSKLGIMAQNIPFPIISFGLFSAYDLLLHLPQFCA